MDGFQCDETELKDYETGEYQDVGNPHSPLRVVDGVEIHGGWPEYEGIDYLGNASEPFALGDTFDIWILPMNAFAEDPALMTLQRVQERLEERENELKRAYKATSLDAPDWSAKYQAVQDIEDAQTLCHFAGVR